jgi:hypothetical protein
VAICSGGSCCFVDQFGGEYFFLCFFCHVHL